MGRVLFLLIVAMGGCASLTGLDRQNSSDSQSEACSAHPSREDSQEASSISCRRHSFSWNDVGDALNGAATAVRFPKP